MSGNVEWEMYSCIILYKHMNCSTKIQLVQLSIDPTELVVPSSSSLLTHKALSFSSFVTLVIYSQFYSGRTCHLSTEVFVLHWYYLFVSE